MKTFKYLLLFTLIIALALPAFAGRRKPKKSVGALVSSIKIALADNPPRYEEAMEYLDEIINTHGMVPEAYYYRGSIYADYAESEYDPQKKLEHLKDMAANHDSLRIACASDEVDDKYRDDCEEYLRIADSARAYYWRDNYNKGVKILARMDKDLVPQLRSATDSTSEAYAMESLSAAADSALAYFKIGMMVDKENYRSYEGAALIYDRIGDYDSSLTYFELAADMAPEEPNLIQSVAYSYIQRNDWENSVKYFRKLMPFIQDQPEMMVNTLFNMSICFNNMQMYDSSFVYNKKIIKIDSTECQAYMDVGQYFLIKSQTYSDSARHYNQADDEATADEYVQKKNNTLDSSAYYFNYAIKCDSNNVMALEQGAIVDMIMGEFESACPKFQRLTQLVPNEKDHWLSLADCQIQMGEFESAIVPYEKYVELDPTDCDVWEQLESLYKSHKMSDKLGQAQAKIKELECK